MSALALEIAGDALVLLREGGTLQREPAFALLEGGAIITGETARRQYRIRPRHVHTRFWDQLGEEQIPGAGLAQADLAHAQLEAAWQAHGDGVDEVYLVTPDGYDREQLGFLLGLAADCGLPVAGLVPSSLAASTRAAPEDRQLLHLDAGLSAFCVRDILQGEVLRGGRQERLASVGLEALRDRWIRHIGQGFLASTRFDPFHDAASEQALFERLPEWLAAVNGGPVTLSLDFQGKHFETRLEAHELDAVAEGTWRALQQLLASLREPGRALAVQLSERVAGLPGLAASLARLGDTVVLALPPGAAVEGALRRRADFARADNGHAALTRALPPAAAPLMATEIAAPREQQATSGAEDTRATHVVWQGVARALSSDALAIGTDPGGEGIALPAGSPGVSARHCELRLLEDGALLTDLSRHGTFVNGSRVGTETRLAPGDRVRVGTPGVELLMVRVR